MLVSKDYVNPTLLGIYHYHKPPVTYWITALGYKIFGVKEFGARFFLQVAILLQLLLVYRISLLLFGNMKISFLAALIYFSFPIVLISSRNLTTDPYLTTLIMAAVYFWLARLKRIHTVWALYAFYCCLGLSILTKGPVALLFVIIFIIVYRFILKTPIKTSIHGVLGFLLFLAISFSWLSILLQEYPMMIGYFWNRQLMDRIFSDSFNRGKPFYYFLLLLPALLFPWILLLFGTNLKKATNFFKEKKISTVLVISSIILFLLFSLFKTKLMLYILPIFWMVAIIIAKQLMEIKPSSLKVLNIAYATLCILLVTASIILYFSSLGNIAISGWHLLNIFMLTASWFLVYYKIDISPPLKTGILASGFSVIILIFAMFFMKNNDEEINSIKDISEFIEQVNPSPNKSVLVYNYLLSSAGFYMKGKIVTINSGQKTTARDTTFQLNKKWRKSLINWQDEKQKIYLNQLLSNPNKILIFRRKESESEKLQLLLPYFSKIKEFKKWVVYYN